MLTITNTNDSGNAQANNQPRYVVQGNIGGVSLWCATARDLSLFSGSVGSVAQTPVRTASTCFMVGLAENIRFQTVNDCAWLWRRIVFKHRGPIFRTLAAGDTPVNPFIVNQETSVGHGRLFLNQAVNAMGNTSATQQAYLFKGSVNVDWRDLMTAPIDTLRVDRYSDVTTRISSGNSRGVIKSVKRWYPMGKNLTYNDDESGDVMTTNNFSVEDKQGMGDFYVYDIFQAAAGATSSDQLIVESTSTLYWHEK